MFLHLTLRLLGDAHKINIQSDGKPHPIPCYTSPETGESTRVGITSCVLTVHSGFGPLQLFRFTLAGTRMWSHPPGSAVCGFMWNAAHIQIWMWYLANSCTECQLQHPGLSFLLATVSHKLVWRRGKADAQHKLEDNENNLAVHHLLFKDWRTLRLLICKTGTRFLLRLFPIMSRI